MSIPAATVDIFLSPGEYFVGDARYRIRTLLGSCVSITLWHPRLRIGAMSHFLLSARAPGAMTGLDPRYGEEVMCLMLRELARCKVAPAECQGKIFGGGDMFPGQARSGAMNVGQKNGETARSLLRAHGIGIVSESLFGAGHRQIVFDVGSGDVWSRQTSPAEAGDPRRAGAGRERHV